MLFVQVDKWDWYKTGTLNVQPCAINFFLQWQQSHEKGKGCSRIKCVGGSGGSFIFFTLPWVVGFLINKILWEVEDIKIKIACLVGKLKATINLCGSSSVLRQLLPLLRHQPSRNLKRVTFFSLRFFVIALSPLSPKIDLPPLRHGAMWVIRRPRSNIAR